MTVPGERDASQLAPTEATTGWIVVHGFAEQLCDGSVPMSCQVVKVNIHCILVRWNRGKNSENAL